MTTPDRRPYLTCAHACSLPDNEPLYPIGSDLVHAVIVREARGWESYYGPEPSEAEPCGPVTKADGGCDWCSAEEHEACAMLRVAEPCACLHSAHDKASHERD